jgi:Fe2+ transport system protein FeoA
MDFMTEKERDPSGRVRPIPIAFADEGQEVVIVEIRGGQFLRKKLADRGFLEGEVVRIVKNSSFGGPVLLGVRGTRFAIGRGEANKIMVLPKKNRVDGHGSEEM